MLLPLLLTLSLLSQLCAAPPPPEDIGEEMASLQQCSVYTASMGFLWFRQQPEPNCLYTIMSPSEDSVVKVMLRRKKGPKYLDCDRESLTLYDGLDDSAPILTQLCGEGKHSKRWKGRSSGSVVTAVLRTSDAKAMSRYSMIYKTAGGR